jgi:putative dehydrogenase
MNPQNSNAARQAAIGVIGLGIMGSAMATEMLARGRKVLGFDIDPQAMDRFVAAGGQACAGAQGVAAEAQVVIVSVASSQALTDVVRQIASVRRGHGAPDLLVLETSTLPLADKLEARSQLEERGITMMDCPISGTAERLRAGAWTIFCSGPESGYARPGQSFRCSPTRRRMSGPLATARR